MGGGGVSGNVADLAAWAPQARSRAQLDAIWAQREGWFRKPSRWCPVRLGGPLRELVPAFETFPIVCLRADEAQHTWRDWESRRTADGFVMERQCSLCGQIDRRWEEQKSECPT